MPNGGSLVRPQLYFYVTVLVLVIGSHFFPVELLPRSVHWKNFAQLKHHGYVVKHAVVPMLDSSGWRTRRISKFCLPLNATAVADCNFYCFHFLMTVKSWLWVSGRLWASSFALLFMEVKGMWRKGREKKPLLQWWSSLKVAQWAGLHPCPEHSFCVGK